MEDFLHEVSLATAENMLITIFLCFFLTRLDCLSAGSCWRVNSRPDSAAYREMSMAAGVILGKQGCEISHRL